MQYDYRLIETTYYNYIYQEEPGGITDIAAESTHRIVWEKRNQGEDFRKQILEDGVFGSRDSDDGRVEYSYQLECRPAGSSEEWKFAGHPEVRRQDDDWYDDCEEEESGY